MVNTMSKGLAAALILGVSAVIAGASAPAAAQAVPPDPSLPGNYPLPEGAGKVLVQQTCTSCHDLRRVVNSNYQPQEWRNVVDMMIAAGTPLTQEQAAVVRDYLIASFPGRPKPKAETLAGPVQVTFQEWTVPTPGSRPHDPLATADGAVWYTGQMADKLGRLDPASGVIREYPLPKGSGPHGLVEDRAGNIWYTANFGAAIGKLDPKSGATVQYPMPDPQARDPHTPLFGKDGILWFTLQNANMIGRFDPATGDIKLVAMPSPRSQPYGMVFDSRGMLFFDEFGANRIGRLDPATLQISEYTLPDPNSRPRRIAITSDDVIWYGDYAQGRLGRLDPTTGKVMEFPSPGGPRSQPYGITVIDDVVWYSESGVQPNTLVRFDPKTQGFQSWAIPSGGGVVRNMMPTRDGGIAMAASGVNGVALARFK
jgi:virginiamycin B lyase